MNLFACMTDSLLTQCTPTAPDLSMDDFKRSKNDPVLMVAIVWHELSGHVGHDYILQSKAAATVLYWHSGAFLEYDTCNSIGCFKLATSASSLIYKLAVFCKPC